MRAPEELLAIDVILTVTGTVGTDPAYETSTSFAVSYAKKEKELTVLEEIVN